MTQRTNTQNASLHLYFSMLADALNDAGYDVRTVLEMRPTMDIPWNGYMVKENLYKPILKAMTGKVSTTEMNTVQPGDVYEVLNRFTAQQFGLSIPWPSLDNQRKER